MNTPANTQKSANDSAPTNQAKAQAENINKTAETAQKETQKNANTAVNEANKTQKKAAKNTKKATKKATKKTTKTAKKATKKATSTAKKTNASTAKSAKKATKSTAKTAKKNTKSASKTAKKSASSAASHSKKTLNQANQWLQGLGNSATYLGQGNIDYVMQSGAMISQNMENISKLLVSNAQQQLQDNINTSQQLLSCQSLEEVKNLQQNYITDTMNRLSNQTRQMTKLSEDLARQTTAPVSSQWNKMIKNITSWAA